MPILDGIDGLTGNGVSIDSKMQFLYDVIPLYEAEGYSGAKALADLRSYDFRIGSDLFYLARRQTLELQNEFETVRYFPRSYVPSDIDLGVTDYPINAQYKFIYRVQNENIYTGEKSYSFFGVETNSFGSIADIEDMGFEYLEDFYPALAEDNVKIEVWKGMRKRQ